MKVETKVLTYRPDPKRDDLKYTDSFTCNVFESIEDILAYSSQSGDNAKEVLDNVNYAFDLKARSTKRQAMAAQYGPKEVDVAKVVERQVRDLIRMRQAAGKPITEEEARRRIALQNSD